MSTHNMIDINSNVKF